MNPRNDFSSSLLLAQLIVFSCFVFPAEGAPTRTGLAPVLPQIEFSETPLADAIDYLRARSLELDPTGAGVNFVVDPAIDSETTVTLRLSRVSIGVAMICLAEQTDLDYRIDAHACHIVPFGLGVLAEKELLRLDHSTSSPQAKVARELDLGQIEFLDAPVPDVLDFLSMKSHAGGDPGLNLVIDHRIDPEIPVSLNLRDAAASTALWALAKQTGLEIRIEPYAIMIEPPGSKFYREQRVKLALTATLKSSPGRPRGKGYSLGTPPSDPRSPAHPDYVSSAASDVSRRTNALNNVYKWVGGKWTFVRHGGKGGAESSLRTSSLSSSRE